MNNEATRKFERKLLIVVAIVVVVGALFLSLVNFIANFLWFREMGYLDVFFKQLVTQLTVGVPTFVVVSVLPDTPQKKLFQADSFSGKHQYEEP